MSDVLVLTECILNGERYQPFTRARVPAHRVEALTSVGWVLPNTAILNMPPAMRQHWADMTSRAAIANEALCVRDEQIDALWEADGRVLSPLTVPSTVTAHQHTTRPLRVLQMTAYDPGCAVYRYHSAANSVPGVVSALVRYGYTNPHCQLRQWDGHAHARTVELLAMSADVIHVHMDYGTLFDELRYEPRADQRIAITYHGSLPPGDSRKTYRRLDADERNNAVVFGARPYHHRHGVPHWLPIPMPVDDYQALRARAQRPDTRAFRVAHSPTKREIKGTREFLRACEYVTDHLGVPVEPVLIEHMDHGEGLALKATCDAVFDSFWLGMQGSGLEGAAMGLPVIAGDHAAVRDLAAYDTECPWTFANTEDDLRTELHLLATNATYRTNEAARVHDYVRTWHDYPAVGRRYAAILHDTVRGERGAAVGC